MASESTGIDAEAGLRVNLLLFQEVDPELYKAVEKVSKRKRGDFIRTLLSIGFAVKNGGQAIELKQPKQSTPVDKKTHKAKANSITRQEIAAEESAGSVFENAAGLNVDNFA